MAPPITSDLTHLADPAAAVAWLRARLGVPVDAALPARPARLSTDSRRVGAGDAFIAWPGYVHDGRTYVDAALAAGAAACLIEADGLEDLPAAAGWDRARVAAVPGLKAATGPVADLLHGQPSRQLRVVGSTGTNGKTSTAWWLAQALTLAGQPCGVIGTLGVGTPPTERSTDSRIDPTGFTTPDPLTVHAALRGFVDAGLHACALEATSIGIAEHRLDAVRIEVMLYTNFTPDHLDYHGSMAAYWQAKRAVFDWPGLRAAVINLDDVQGAGLAAELQAQGRLDVWTYAAAPLADGGGRAAPARHLQASALRYEAQGLAFDLTEAGQTVAVRSALVGDYNVANLLAVIGGLRALGLPLDQAAQLMAQCTSVPGRMQRVGAGVDAPQVVVDYAHTPDALDKALQAVRPLAAARGGRLVCVFGCGGNRDAGKRPVMGGIAARGADAVFVTSDNPRLEPPDAIIDQILAGCAAAAQAPSAARLATVQRIVDRHEAIRVALQTADARDVVLIAGKGHEDYQDIGGVRLPFSDIEASLRWLPATPAHSGAAP